MNTSIERLKNLAAVGDSLLAFPRKNNLAFGVWDSGANACLAGHYERVHHAGLTLGGWGGFEAVASLCAHFGLIPQEAQTLFASTAGYEADVPGDAAYTELGKRLEYLRGLIATREQNIVRAIHDAAPADVIPETVRAYFFNPPTALPCDAFEDEVNLALEEAGA